MQNIAFRHHSVVSLSIFEAKLAAIVLPDYAPAQDLHSAS
jgi:hypothetical protein